MKTKLILSEELTGFKKSTITKFIQKILIARQIESELLHERNLGQPADYNGVVTQTRNLKHHFPVKKLMHSP